MPYSLSSLALDFGDKHKYVDFIVEDVAQAQANTSLMDRYTDR